MIVTKTKDLKAVCSFFDSMTSPPLDTLFQLGQNTVVKTFYLPIDETAPDFQEGWLREIISRREGGTQKISRIKSHAYVKTGKIIQAELGPLGLPVLFYTDNEGNPLNVLNELVFRHGPAYGRVTERFQQLTARSESDLSLILRSPGEFMYGHETIDPALAGITQAGNFQIDSFGPCPGCSYKNRTKAAKAFVFQDGRANLAYLVSLGPDGRVDNFSIELALFSGKEVNAGLSVKIDAKKQDDHYVPTAEVRVNSQRISPLDGQRGIVTYTFGPDGQFVSIQVHESGIVLYRNKIEAMERIYKSFEGIVWCDGLCYVELDNHPGVSAQLKAVVTAVGAEHHAIGAIKKGELTPGRDFTLVPANSLNDAPGLKNDLRMIQSYRQFAADFLRIRLFEGAQLEKLGVDYSKAIEKLAGLQYSKNDDVLLIGTG